MYTNIGDKRRNSNQKQRTEKYINKRSFDILKKKFDKQASEWYHNQGSKMSFKPHT